MAPMLSLSDMTVMRRSEWELKYSRTQVQQCYSKTVGYLHTWEFDLIAVEMLMATVHYPRMCSRNEEVR